MSLHCSLPPPIRDSASGKTYVAIPAPPFILAKDADSTTATRSLHSNSAFGYVYVERTAAPSSRRVFTGERSEIPKEKLSIDNWMVKHCSSEPPPGHVPWSGQVPLIYPVSSGGSLADSTMAFSVQDASFDVSVVSLDSSSSFDIPAFDSGDTLLNSSLPSMCSSAWSAGISPPPISAALTQRPLSSPSPVICQPHPASTGLDKRRYTVCLPDLSSRREAHVFGRRTLEKIGKVGPSDIETTDASTTPKETQMLSQIDDLDAFFSTGLKKMDSTMLHLDEEKNRLEAPSLVVSTSTAILPVSLESCADLMNIMPPLALRRGKDIPGELKIDSTLAVTSLDYPDVPTPFRGSPHSIAESFADAPRYPTLVLDSKMTAEQMISSLRSQVETFYPKRPSATIIFADQCTDAEKWLEDELLRSRDEDASLMNCPSNSHSSETEESVSVKLPHTRPCPPLPSTSTLVSMSSPVDSVRKKRSQILQFTPGRTSSVKTGGVKLPTDNLKSWNAKPSSCATPRPRKSILSDGSSTTGSEKKVRFSSSPPITIPHNIFEKKSEKKIEKKTARPTVTTAGTGAGVSPTKRKPPPSVSSVKSPVTRGPFSSTPMKPSPLSRKPSPFKPVSTPLRQASPAPPVLNNRKATDRTQSLSAGSAPAVSLPKTPLSLRRCASEVLSPSPPPPASSVAADADANADASLAPAEPVRPPSLGVKENRTLKVAGITIAKRRGFDAADKENRRNSTLADEAAQKKLKSSKSRSLGFQSVLNRLRG